MKLSKARNSKISNPLLHRLKSANQIVLKPKRTLVSKLGVYFNELATKSNKPMYWQLQKVLKMPREVSSYSELRNNSCSHLNMNYSRTKNKPINSLMRNIDWSKSPLYNNVTNGMPGFSYYKNSDTFLEFELDYIISKVRDSDYEVLKKLHNKSVSTFQKLVEELSVQKRFDNINCTTVSFYTKI